MSIELMRAVVTGGSGFIGSSLVDRLLAEGHDVDVVDDLSTGSLATLAQARTYEGRFRFHQFDVSDPEVVDLIAMRRPDVIFHLAGQTNVRDSIEHPIRDAKINVIGSLNVLEGARLSQTRKVVFAASGGALYGEGDHSQKPTSESNDPRPRTPYGVAKHSVIEYLSVFRELYGLEFTALALASVYGPRQYPSDGSGVIAQFVQNIVHNSPSVIFGDGSQVRDFIYIDDVVDAFARSADRGSGLVINIGSGTGTTIRALYAEIASHFADAPSALQSAARTGDLKSSVLDISRARIHLGWSPWTSLQEGLGEMIEAAQNRELQRGSR